MNPPTITGPGPGRDNTTPEPTAVPTAFKVGDVVVLKSGGPRMTVGEVVQATEEANQPERVGVVWVNRTGAHERALLPSACVMLANSSARVTEVRIAGKYYPAVLVLINGRRFEHRCYDRAEAETVAAELQVPIGKQGTS